MKVTLIDAQGFIDASRHDITDYKAARSVVERSKIADMHIIQRDRGIWTLDVYGPLGKIQIIRDYQQYFEVNYENQA
ncbi:hypothetical protein UGMREWDR_CDS0081 [Aeromonas phage GomatiRiver_11]|nr:hypothetical protein OBDJBBDK_00075 [Aeromonas phage AhFM11]WKW84248.1 hypothetical protein UGMREWDR_CDS0081 [Aeromonas phage GomatiRiver_11]